MSEPYDTKPDWATKVETPWSIPHFEKMLLDLLLLLFLDRYPLRFFLHDNALQFKMCVAIYYHFCSVLVSVPIYLDTDWGIVGPQSHIDIKGDMYQESARMGFYIFTAVCVNLFHSVWFVIFRFAFLLFVLGQSPVECWQVSLRVQYICPRQITIRAEQIFAHFQDKSYIGNVVHDIWYCMVFFSCVGSARGAWFDFTTELLSMQHANVKLFIWKKD